MTRVAILQSNYVPWRGYFDIIRRVDDFVLYDTAQYTKNDWRNRNRIMTPNGPVWLTIPVLHSARFGQTISETQISDRRWTKRHLGTLQAGLARAPFFRSTLAPALIDWYAEAGALDRLSKVNCLFIERIMQIFGMTTRLHDAADLPQDGDRTGKLVSICKSLGAKRYLSGPAARSYLDESQFQSNGIEVEWMDYPTYPSYAQANGSHDPAVSILDTLAYLPPEKVF
jgi:hypothetical protein